MEKPQTKSALSKAKNEVKERLPTKLVKENCNRKAAPPPPPAKENKRQKEFTLHTQDRALRRAMFDYSVASKFYVMEVYKRQIHKAIKMIEEEEIRLMRKDMVPRAQLMPYFDRPFLPQRSNRKLTVPREPCFHNANSKCWSCMSDHEISQLFQNAPLFLNPQSC